MSVTNLAEVPYRHLCVVLLFTLVFAGTAQTHWSPTEEEGPFAPTSSVLEQWSELTGGVRRGDELSLPEEKVMKKTTMAPDRIVNRPPSSPSNRPQDASETDMFLLGAIEKLAYKIDFLEKRTRRVEDMLYQILAGTATTEGEKCPNDFTSIGGLCYHISTKQLNWKAASSQCRSLGAVLTELDSEQQKTRVLATLQTQLERQVDDYWTGGLNPGLLWLWGSSAKPVVANNATAEIPGNGRCLLLAFHPPKRQYQYKGADCSIKHRYICQIEDNTTERRLQRLLRDRQIKHSTSDQS